MLFSEEILESCLLFAAIQRAIGPSIARGPYSPIVPSYTPMQLQKEYRMLAGVCRRFRRILLPHLYRDASLFRASQWKLGTADLLQERGELLHNLHIEINAYRPTDCDLLRLLHEQLQYLTSLRVLHLSINLDPSLISTPPAMNEAQLQDWKMVSSSLPVSLQELHLNGSFNWSDATEGLGKVHLPNLRRLSIRLQETVPASSSSSLFAKFPKVKDLTLPATWCPNSQWFQEVFSAVKLDRFALGITDPSPDEVLDENHVERHESCKVENCSWGKTIREALLFIAPTLPTLVIGTPSIIDAKLPTNAFTSLTSLHLNLIQIYDDAELEALFAPFLASPLVELRLTQCGDIPQTFASWFNPSSKKKWPKHSRKNQKGPRWPTLKKLTIDKITAASTQVDGDWSDDEETQERLEALKDFFFWDDGPREGLVKFCKARNIELDVEWDWIEDIM